MLKIEDKVQVQYFDEEGKATKDYAIIIGRSFSDKPKYDLIITKNKFKLSNIDEKSITLTS